MKRPLVALRIATDPMMRAKILNGAKKISIREGHRDYQAGDTLMICCHLEVWCVEVKVTEVRHCTVSELSREECREDGFADAQDALVRLRNYYPSLAKGSPVTVIHWDGVNGRLTEI